MGAVYEARQEPLERRVALKTLHADHAQRKEAIARFFNEAKVLSRLEHPSIVQVSDFGHAADGTAYLVMEYLRGQSLGHRIRALSERGERLPVATALQVCVQVASVLVVAHAQCIVHRDLKPENLMLVGDPVAPGGERVKVLDFGIAKLTDDRSSVKTATAQVMGTPPYMSPEQCAGAGGVDAQTDVYALGCVLYELLAGRTPFVADGLGLLIAMHLYEEPLPLLSIAPQVPQQTAELVHRMLRKDKTQRPTMKEAADELARQLSMQTGGTLEVRPTPQVISGPNEKTVLPSGAQSSTIGRSIGQSIKQPTRTKARLVQWGGGALAMGLVSVLWVSQRPSLKPQPSLSATKPSTEETQMQTPEWLDLGLDPLTDSGASSGGDAKPGMLTTPASKPKPRQRTPPTDKKASNGQSARPVDQTPPKKRFGYEE